jgi:hypothetical protein
VIDLLGQLAQKLLCLRHVHPVEVRVIMRARGELGFEGQ